MRTIGSNICGVQGDVAKLADLDRLYEDVEAKGRIDIIFANAGIGEFASLGDVTEEHFDKIFNINVKGTLFMVQKSLPLLNNGGSIILTGSVASAKETPGLSVYGASKAAIRNFARGWTVELKDRHIPGPRSGRFTRVSTLTRMTDAVTSDDLGFFYEGHPRPWL